MKGKKEDRGRKEKEREEKGSVQKLQLFVESFKKNGSLLFPSFPPFFPQKTSKLLKFFLFLCDVKPRVFLFLLKKRGRERKGEGGSGRKGKEGKETEGKGRVRENEGQKKGKKGGKTTNKKQTQKGKKRR